MRKTEAIDFIWDADAGVMRPAKADAELAKRQFVDARLYTLVPEKMRSAKSHKHYFAALREAHRNLPENLAPRFPKAEHLRAFALVRTGYCDHRAVTCGTPRLAKAMAAVIRPMSPFIVMQIEGSVLNIYTPMSQSVPEMDAETFQKSKTAVLDFVSDLIGVNRTTLNKEADRVAPRDRPQQMPVARTPIASSDDLPTNAEEYASYFQAWLNEATNGRAAHRRFESEKPMRDICKVKISVRVQMQELLSQRFEDA